MKAVVAEFNQEKALARSSFVYLHFVALVDLLEDAGSEPGAGVLVCVRPPCLLAVLAAVARPAPAPVTLTLPPPTAETCPGVPALVLAKQEDVWLA